MYRALPTEQRVAKWITDKVGPYPTLYIPQGHANAFVGVLVEERLRGVLDEEIVILNLIRKGLSNDEAIEYLLNRARNPIPGWPVMMTRYDHFSNND